MLYIAIFLEVDLKKNQINTSRFSKSEQNTSINNNTQSIGKNHIFDIKDNTIINISYVSVVLAIIVKLNLTVCRCFLFFSIKGF